MIESNPNKYLRTSTQNDEKVLNYLNNFKIGFSGVYAHKNVEARNKTSQAAPTTVHPVAALAEKGGYFPRKGNSTE